MAVQDHIINRQLFEFECVHSEHAFQLRNKFDHDVQYRITKAIERACNELAAEGEDIRIPVMEIDLGTISFNRLESDIVIEFEKQFYKKLSEQKNELNTDDLLTAQKRTSLDILKYFLLTGRLPWFAGKKDVNIIDELLYETFADDEAEFRRFILLNLGNEKFIERLISRDQPHFINRLIDIIGISSELVSYVELKLKNIVEALLVRIQADSKTQEGYDQAITSGRGPTAYFLESMRYILFNVEQEKDKINIFFRRFSLETILKFISPGCDIDNNEKFHTFFYKIISEKFELNEEIIHSVAFKLQADAEQLSKAGDTARKIKDEIRIIVEQQLTEPEQQVDALKFYISNAGLILVSNYFPAFFDQLGLLENGDLAKKPDKIRAVFILHYLCTGKEEAPEYILPLNKILCGLSLDEPLPSIVLLSETEKNECEELLQEVILNWQKVGNLSIDGLRESFLARDGILTQENNGWKLTVERKGYDVLLDSMSWSFNHVRLGWMNELITTEW